MLGFKFPDFLVGWVARVPAASTGSRHQQDTAAASAVADSATVDPDASSCCCRDTDADREDA